MNEERLTTDETRVRSRWLRPEVAFLIVLVVAVYFTMMTALPVRGEETRWARVATEMLESGDWIVPRQQGYRFLDRPPLGPWTMALVGWARGQVDRVAIRLPSVLATLVTMLLVYGYGCRSLSRLGAFSAAATYPSFALVLQLGWTGENEAVYTLLLSGALLLWHWGYVRSWPMALTWSVGYGLTALAMLVKGPQAPAYFVAVTTVYLLIQWRRQASLAKHEVWSQVNRLRLTSASYLAGVGVFLLVAGLWLVPFYLRGGRQWVIDILTRTSAIRYSTDGLLSHMALYPLEIWASMLPGSIVLVGLLYPRLWRQLDRAPSEVRFAVTALLVTFPSVWLAQGAHPRYFMPLLPCAAVPVGWAIERLVAARPASAAQRWWQVCMAGAALGVAGLGAVLLVAGRVGSAHLAAIAPSRPQVYGHLAALVAIAGVLIWATVHVRSRSAGLAVAALAIFQGLLFRGLLTGARQRSANDLTQAMAELRQTLPDDVRLVSFGRAHHRFAYYYQTAIAELPWPKTADQVPPDVTYFCFDPRGYNMPLHVIARADSLTLPADGVLPFQWEQIARLMLDSSKKEVPEELTLVGRIIRAPDATFDSQ